MDFNPRPRINARAFLKDRYPPFERRSKPDRRSPCRNRSISDRLSNPRRRLRPDRRSLSERLSVLSFQVSWFATPSPVAFCTAIASSEGCTNRAFPCRNFASSDRSKRSSDRRSRPDRRSLLLPFKKSSPMAMGLRWRCSVIEIRKSNLKWESAAAAFRTPKQIRLRFGSCPVMTQNGHTFGARPVGPGGLHKSLCRLFQLARPILCFQSSITPGGNSRTPTPVRRQASGHISSKI